MRALVLSALCLAAVAVVIAADRPEGRPFATRSTVYARHGMVAAAHPLAVQIGLDILKRGGSAVDAAIATNAALALMEPNACGLGGDLFAMVWDPAKGELTGLNGSGRSPAGLTIDKVPPLPDGTIPLYSPYAWTVPGCADGWFELHSRYGRLPMAEVLALPSPPPAKGRRCRRSSPAPGSVASPASPTSPGSRPCSCPAAARRGSGSPSPTRPSPAPSSCSQPAAGTRSTAVPSPTAWWPSPAEDGGFFSAEDLAAHRSEWVTPVSTTYRGVTVWELPPNGQGIAALQMLNMLEGFDLAAMGRDSADFWHLLVEVTKLAFADRARFYADPSVADIPLAGLVDKKYARQRATLVDMARAARSVNPGNPHLGHGDTTYLATADERGQMVSLIQSNYTGFGSGYVVPELGFGLQNRGSLFSLDPGHPNALAPGKRPFHTIIPAFLGERRVPTMAFGVMGGTCSPRGTSRSCSTWWTSE